MTRKRKYKNRREPRRIPLLRSTWYYLGQLAEQNGMTTAEFAELLLMGAVMDRVKLIETRRKWGR